MRLETVFAMQLCAKVRAISTEVHCSKYVKISCLLFSQFSLVMFLYLSSITWMCYFYTKWMQKCFLCSDTLGWVRGTAFSW